MPAPMGHAPYNTLGEGGRPKKYTKEFIEHLADEFEIWMRDSTKIWLKDFFNERGLSPKLLSEWVHINERFSEVYEIAKELQEARLVKGSLFKKLCFPMAKMVLVNHHKYKSDNIDQQNNSAVTIEIVKYRDIDDTKDDTPPIQV